MVGWGMGWNEEEAEDANIKISFGQIQQGLHSLFSFNTKLFHVTNGISVNKDFFLLCSFFLRWGHGHILKKILNIVDMGFPGGSEVKLSVFNAGDPGSIPGLGRSPGEGNGNPFHYSCLENPMVGGAW